MKTSKPAFTLIELLVVIAVIGILAAFAIASFSSAQARARDAERKNDLDQMKKALYMYRNDSGAFCPGGTSGSGCVVGTWWSAQFSNIDWGADGTNANSLNKILTPNYIKKIPRDPKFNTDADDYYLHANADEMYLSSKLENEKDPRYNNNPGCATATDRNYCITQD